MSRLVQENVWRVMPQKLITEARGGVGLCCFNAFEANRLIQGVQSNYARLAFVDIALMIVLIKILKFIHLCNINQYQQLVNFSSI